MHPVQEAFVACHGLQCGFCTPGMLMSACHLIDTSPDADRESIRAEMSGNICRCTGYQGIVDAVERARAEMTGSPGRGRDAVPPWEVTYPEEWSAAVVAPAPRRSTAEVDRVVGVGHPEQLRSSRRRYPPVW